MENLLVILAFVVLSALSGWLKKKGQSGESEPGPKRVRPTPIGPRTGGQHESTTPGPARPTKPAAFDWEAELRRLLEGEPATPPASTEHAPPPVEQLEMPPIPVIRPAERIPPPAPMPVSRPDKPSAKQPLVLPTTPSQRQVLKVRTLEPKPSRMVEPVIDQHPNLPRVEHIPAFVATTSHAARSEIAAAVQLLRSPQSARQAIIAGMLLGPPRGLE
jgi:hypothetical protein